MSILRLILLLLCIALLTTALAIPVSASRKDAFLPGDLNGDGQRSVIDYIMLKRHVLGTYVIPEVFLPAADINGNGELNALDYLLLKRAILGTFGIPEAPHDPSRPSEGLPSEVRFAVAFSYLYRTADRDRLLQLEAELGVNLDALNHLVVTYLASLSIDGEELLALEREIALQIPSAEELETFLRQLAAWLETILPEQP